MDFCSIIVHTKVDKSQYIHIYYGVQACFSFIEHNIAWYIFKFYIITYYYNIGLTKLQRNEQKNWGDVENLCSQEK